MPDIAQLQAEYQASLRTAHGALKVRDETSVAATEASNKYNEAVTIAKKKRIELLTGIDASAGVPSHVVPHQK